ncbi:MULTISPECIES: tRNA pseudouridine(38-40) synthase TruA [Methanobrevibacter]|uniref:tRNA pseudouridine(38-40) synthase TruA n=1 Tax=Methanobrevibacter TaxID=2172 RepID=UPI0025CCE131|nr:MULTISPECIES: tRNA pseudouridine(38-40) synthase TruA [Methanobrevibacter]MBS7258436.1 tRNA pseudouridine(38-40) synthase TruA [Methanobrevibacter sp.]MDD6776109.1 tRNA pseudouridine(38-40) synthase TruA [Methanobacteriaceae archaeon]MDY3096402.1 tRNA pseudouridine(38-40) synthase TruA [Methanobrevibacter sp.]
MKRTALKIGYIGTNFHGFQRQPDLRTVEEELIYHLRKLNYIDDLKKSRFRIAGRTDAGVHSLGNVISFQSEKDVRINEINNSLPDDIQILASAPVRYAFKPRYAQMRQYRYVLFQDLDIDKLKQCAEVFKGTHNFTNFTKRFQKTTTRTIEDIKITKADLTDYHKKEFPNLHDTLSPIFVDIYGESFLWNMVRKMMRVFVDVATDKMSLDEVEKLLNPAEGEPRANIKVMEADYLILMDIQYDGIKFRYDDYACERFKRDLVDSLSDLQKRYAVRESMIKSLNELHNLDE